jgi:hypothetical protein
MAKRSPPIPSIMGSITPSTALAAIAASMADPPRARICAPAWDARVWLVATIPEVVITMERAWARLWAMMGGCMERVNTTMKQNLISALLYVIRLGLRQFGAETMSGKGAEPQRKSLFLWN